MSQDSAYGRRRAVGVWCGVYPGHYLDYDLRSTPTVEITNTREMRLVGVSEGELADSFRFLISLS